ncbi:MAG TPA: hypothetical protein PKE69_14575, partial [Pyrinomonadaceae bacterium]|nr:hypothetical protein [Pyrinomonadaceae bacterium]
NMKKTLILGLVAVTFSINGCTFNVGTPTNTANVNAPNTANSAPTKAENKPSTTTNATAAPKKQDDAVKDSDSTTSVVKPRTTRDQFAKGETSTSVTKDIQPNGSVDFLINVQKGQTMDYTVGYDFEDSDLTVYMAEPGDQDASIPAAPKTPQTFVVKKSGDHRLEVSNTTKKKVTITLYLDVE